MKQILAAAIASIAALAAQASEVNLISLAVTNIVETTYSEGNVSVATNIQSVVIGVGGFNSYNQWGVCWWDNKKDCAFDGFGWYDNNGTTQAQGHVEFTSEEAIWTGYQVSAAAVVSRIRFLSTPNPESDGWVRAERTLGCSFQAANSADFSDAVTLYTVGDGGETKYSLTNGWQEVPVSSAQSFTYLRFYAPADKAGGSIAEVEFYGQTWAEATSGTPSAAPQNLAISSVDADTDAVKLTWDAPTEPCCSAKVIRSTAPGGSTFDVTLETLSATTLTYTDSDAARIPGVTYYYRVAFANEDNVGPVSEAVSHRHVVQLERTSLSDTQLKAGMSVIGYNWNLDTTGARAFDGDIATFADLNAEETDKVNIKIGVDLGSAYVIDSFKIYPRSDSYLYRLNGVVLGASNDSGNWMNGTAISASCGITAAQWYTFETTDKAAYRYVYVMKPNDGDFYGNVAELALYGYTLESSQSVLLAPEDLAAEWHGTRAVVTWTASPNAVSYKVERSSDGGATWTVLVDGITDTTYADRPTKATSISYIYRVASVDGNGGLAYTISITPTGTPAAPGLSIFFR